MRTSEWNRASAPASETSFRQKLYRYDLAQLQVFGTINFAHAAAAGQRNHAIASAMICRARIVHRQWHRNWKGTR